MQSVDVLKQIAGDDRDTEHQFTVYPTIRNPIQAAPSTKKNVPNPLKKQIKFLHLKLKLAVLFVSKKKKKNRAQPYSILAYHIHQLLYRPQVLHILSFDKTCNLSCSYTSLSHYISLEGTSYVTEEGCVESET